MRSLIRLLIPLTLIAAIIGPGCYTMIRHPKDETSHRKVDQLSDCTSCHVDYGSYPYGYYYDPYPDYWWDHPGYSAYYAYPWWWSYYEYPYLDGSYKRGESSLRGTKFDQREAVYIPPPPYSLPDAFKVEMPILPPSYNNRHNSNNSGNSSQSRPGSGSDVSTPPTRSREDNGSIGSGGKATRKNTKASPTRSRGSKPVPTPKPDEGQQQNNTNQNPPPPDSLKHEG